MHAVELTMVQVLPFFVLKSGPFGGEVVLEKSHSPCRKKRIFQTKNKNDQKVVLKTGPTLLRNKIGPVLTQPWTSLKKHFGLCVFDETPIFSVFSKACKI